MSTQVSPRLSKLSIEELTSEWEQILNNLILAEQSNAPSYGYREQLKMLEGEFRRRGIQPVILEEQDIAW